MMRTKTTLDRQVSETEKPASLAGFFIATRWFGQKADIQMSTMTGANL